MLSRTLWDSWCPDATYRAQAVPILPHTTHGEMDRLHFPFFSHLHPSIHPFIDPSIRLSICPFFPLSYITLYTQDSTYFLPFSFCLFFSTNPSFIHPSICICSSLLLLYTEKCTHILLWAILNPSIHILIHLSIHPSIHISPHFHLIHFLFFFVPFQFFHPLTMALLENTTNLTNLTNYTKLTNCTLFIYLFFTTTLLNFQIWLVRSVD